MNAHLLKTHVVLDLHYHPDDGQECFDGTRQECEDFVTRECEFSFSSTFMLKVIPMSKDEIENHPDNKWYFYDKDDSKPVLWH